MNQGHYDSAVPGASPVSADKRFQLAEGFVKTVLNLATGALVLSVTFLHDIVGIGSEKPHAQITCTYLIGAAWIALLLSIAAALFYLYFLAVAAKFERGYSRHLRWGALATIFFFAGGLVLLALFAWYNLPA
jgi:hypothetical protein